MTDMVSISDYPNFGDGFGIASASDVENLSKALNTGDYAQADGVAAQTNGASLQVESLEGSLKALTYSEQNIKLWKRIPKSAAYATVEEYNQLLSYGQSNGGFVLEGELPATQDSEYRRKATFIKFLGTTREVTHPMTLVRSAHGNVIALENRNGILWLLKQLEHALFWGNSSLAASGKEGVQFDGLDAMIPDDNTIDLKGEDLHEKDINNGANLILENYGTPTDLYLPFEVLQRFSEQFFPKERVIMPTQAGYQAGIVVNQFQTYGGPVEFQPDLFLQKTKPLRPSGEGGVKAPTAPSAVTVALGNETDAEFDKSGAGTYTYSVTAANRFGESIPVNATADVAITAADFQKGVTVTILNADAMVVEPEWFNIYRSEKDGTEKFCIMRVPAQSTVAGGSTVAVDKNSTMPNTYTAFMGEMSPQVIEFKQLAPIMKMDLAQLGPVYRWMILLYGTPVLYMPRKWMKFRNIKASSHTAPNGLYY